MTLYCLFCGTVIDSRDTSIREGEEERVTCAHCYAVFLLKQNRKGCLTQVRVKTCGKECSC